MTLKEYLGNDRFAINTGCVIEEVAEGYSKVKMVVGEQHLNAGGVCQGGALFTLADFAFAAAVNSHGQLTFSINTTISFVSSAKAGDVLTAEAREVFDHPKLPYGEVRITKQDGTLIASFSGQAYRKSVQLPIE